MLDNGAIRAANKAALRRLREGAYFLRTDMWNPHETLMYAALDGCSFNLTARNVLIAEVNT